MAMSRERLRAIASIQTANDISWKERLKQRRLHKNAEHWRYGGITTYCVFDEADKELRISLEHGRAPVVFTRDDLRLPGGIRIQGGPTRIFVDDGLTLNPESILPSTIMTPIPTFIPSPSPLDGILGSITSILGGI